ncbi:MAG: glutamine--fructose-6-phosphate transaminase (isomerizing) [Pirellulales bacterium]|nr:glutamine--fructose-6-phosphate transaminase (isomerizing) [Pirellulales bacterium]
MCGIIGYIGPRDATDILVEGLRKLEYRGYDSAGLATLDESSDLRITKAAGKINQLVSRLQHEPTPGQIGVGHTRWATHGPATDINAHPHIGGDQILAVVHNGVIENYRPLKERLESQGYTFHSDTDTETIAHQIAACLEEQLLTRAAQGDEPDEQEALAAAVQEAVAKFRGTFGLAVLFRGHTDTIIAARRGSPLVVGVGEDEHFLASDAAPLVGHTKQIVYLADHEIAVITADSLRVIHRDQGLIQHDVEELEISASDVDRGGYDHYMLKEIFEQPESLENTMRGRLDEEQATAHFGGLNLTPRQLQTIRRILMTACGTSWHAGLVGEYLLEEFARMPVEVEYASELRYRNPPLDDRTLLFAITQSGETADTLAALNEIKRKGLPTLSICNVVGSSIAQESDGGIYLHAGPEIGVASTKAFTSQCVALVMLALYFGRLRHLSYTQGTRIIQQLRELPDQVRAALECNEAVKDIAAKYHQCENFLYLGRQYNFPVALEGALKLKEISYIHAEGYPAAEMKHGPIALVDENTPSVFLIPQGVVYDKVLANMEEIKARGGPIIAVVCEGDTEAVHLADDVIRIPSVADFLQPILTIVPLQLLAYHIAVLRGCDVDQPRNLAKSVTVE